MIAPITAANANHAAQVGPVCPVCFRYHRISWFSLHLVSEWPRFLSAIKKLKYLASASGSLRSHALYRTHNTQERNPIRCQQRSDALHPAGSEHIFSEAPVLEEQPFHKAPSP
jgi:hypothetical protein